MAGIFEVLDTLAGGVANVAGRVVDGKTQIEVARAATAANPARVPDQSSAAPAATLSGSLPGGIPPLAMWIGGGLVLVLLVALVARR